MAIGHTTFPLPLLRGKRILVTRARAQAQELVTRLQELGAIPIVFSVIHIVPPADNYVALDAALRQLATFDWVVFTSVNGVVHVWERLAVLGLEAGGIRHGTPGGHWPQPPR